MKTLEQHWEEKRDEAFRDKTKEPTGITCPVKDCGGEILANYTEALLSYPVKYNAKCSRCGTHQYI